MPPELYAAAALVLFPRAVPPLPWGQALHLAARVTGTLALIPAASVAAFLVSESDAVTKQYQFHSGQGVLRQEFYLLNPVARRDLTVDGFYLLHGKFDRLPYSVRKAGLREKDRGFADFIPLDPAVCEPRPWAAEDFARLGGIEVPDGYFEEERKPPPPRDLLAGLGKRFVGRPRSE